MQNSPHLKPAFVLDELLRRFSHDIATDYDGLGRFRHIHNEHDLSAVVDYMQYADIPVGSLSSLPSACVIACEHIDLSVYHLLSPALTLAADWSPC